MMNIDLKRIDLHPGREKRLLQGHRWVFSNELSGNLSEFEPGSWVAVHSSKGVCLGSGYINPHSLIAVRLICPAHEKPSQDTFRGLLKNAAQRRQTLFYPDSQCTRVVYGEADGLPGLIVDRYGEVLVYQITTLGMALLEDLVRELLIELFQPKAMVFRNDTPVRTLEGLPIEKGLAYGELPDPCSISIDGLEFIIDPIEGQKTGFYLDQRENRKVLRRWSKGKRVLDLFCYNGAWGLSAASAGALEVLGVDQASEGLTQGRSSAALNNLEGICRFQKEEAFYFLKTVKRGAFDIIILDPPSFARTRSVIPQAVRGYTDLNRRAMLALEPGGILVSCSCSYHMSETMFREMLLKAAQASGRQLRLLEARGQAMDHPVLLAMPETGYLKCYFLEVLP
jgi:23S rRNA (cytosine1962-C5)-methyltransferase